MSSPSYLPVKVEDDESGSDLQQDRKTLPPRNPDGNKLFEDEDGNPIWFFFHRSVRGWRKDVLTKIITSHGGVVRDDESQVDTVIVDENRCDKHSVQLVLNTHSDRSKRGAWVEPMSFVDHCIKLGSVKHRLPQPKGMGGSERLLRRPFTQEDDEHLARHIALRIPDAKNGGRRGNRIYQELEQAYHEDPKEFAWVARHSWQSWRNRLNKNVDRFMPMIDRYVESEEPGPKQAYELRRKRQFLDESNDDEVIVEQPGSSFKRRRDNLSPAPSAIRSPLYTTKGKEKAVAEEEQQLDNGHHSLTYAQFEEGESGPSRKAPKRTYADRRNRQARASSPANNQEPQTSQATLVEPEHENKEPGSQAKGLFDSEFQHPEATQTPVVSQPIVDIRQNGNNTYVSPATASIFTETLVTSDVFSGGAVARPAVIKMARRRRAQPAPSVVIPADPPYRNTRSRSRSVEPLAIPPRMDQRRKKARILEDRRHSLSLLEESATEEDLGETLQDENDVEDLLLVNMSRQSHNSGNDLAAVEQKPMNEDDSGRSPMDSDDAQIDSWLRPLPPVPAKTRTAPPMPDIGPNEMLRLFDEANRSGSSRRTSALPMPVAQLQNARQTQPQSFPEHRRGVFGEASLTPRQIRTPQASIRRGSTSSRDSFPIAGTKASVAKKMLETEEKRTPYMPPAGTRAARLSMPEARNPAVFRSGGV